jgi:hypothetical protein
VYEGLSGSIVLDGYEHDMDTKKWEINSDCKSLLIKSTIFDTEAYMDYLYIEDTQGYPLGFHSGSRPLNHVTNTGNVILAFGPVRSAPDRQCLKKLNLKL